MIAFPAAASAPRHIRLMWEKYVTAPEFRGSTIWGLAVIFGLLVLYLVQTRRGWFVWVASLVASVLILTFASAVLWRRGGGADRSLVVRPGGVELTTPAWRAWYPTEEIARWSLTGSCFAIEFRGIGHASFDASSVEVDRRMVAELLAAPPEPDLEVPWHLAASWTSTAATVRQAHLARTQLAPTRVPRIVAIALVIYAFLFVVLWIGALSEAVDGRGGWVRTVQTSTAVLGDIAVRSALFTAIIVGIIFLLAKRALSKRLVGDSLSLLVEPDSFALVRSGWAPTRVPWAAVARVRVNEDWVEIVTVDPVAPFAVPGWAFLPGERDAFVDRLAATP